MRGGEGIFKVIVGIAILAAPALVAGDHAVEGGHILRVPHLGAPIGAGVGLPRVPPTAPEAVGWEPHDLQGAIAGQDHQIAPGERVAVFLFDRPDQAARLVCVAVVPPALDWRKALPGLAGAAAAVSDAIGSRRVPGHADHLRPVVAVVRRPPGHRGGQKALDVPLERREVDRVEFGGIVEVFTQRIGLRPVLVQELDLQTVRIPVG